MTPRAEKIRLGFMVSLIALGFTGISARLAWLHVGPHGEMRAQVSKARYHEKNFRANRGRILDRSGRIMALDLGRANVTVDASYFASKHTNVLDQINILEGLAGHLQMDLAMVKGKVLPDDGKLSQYVMLQKAVSVDVAEEIKSEINTQNIKGIMVEPISKRYYPHRNLLSHVVGFANVLGDGCAGVEMEMDKYLKGRAGLRTGMKDGRKHELYEHKGVQIDAISGGNIFLTVDQYLQFHLERELQAAVTNYNAKGAWAMIMDVKTGAILAMGSKPDYDLNHYSSTPLETMRNQNVAMLFEPGSTMKPVVIAAALNEGLIDPHELIFCENKAWSYAGRILHDFHGYGDLSVEDVLKKSSNIGTAKIALRLGDQKLDEYMRRFGFGSKTGIMLPGEQRGIFRPHNKWEKISITRIAMGHEISQTALQVLTGINTIANNGFRVQPRIVERIEDADGNILHEFMPKVVDQPISIETAKIMQGMMARIAEKGGTGRRAAMENYRIAVKTGTAEKVVNGRYDRSKNVASMVGFLPAEAPVISMIVVVDEPQPLHTGGVVAGPVFKNIAEKAVRILNIPPSPPVLEETVVTGSPAMMRIQTAR